MYLDGLEVKKDLFQMAKIWYDRACESGNVVTERDRDKFIKTIEERQKRSSDVLEAVNAAINYLNSLQAKITPSVVCDRSYIQDYKMLSELANRGSITAKQLCAPLDHFAQALLARCTYSIVSQLDEDVRLCYDTLHFNSYQLVNEFLDLCKKKYPKSIYFFLLSGAINGFLRQAEMSLYNTNTGLARQL